MSPASTEVPFVPATGMSTASTEIDLVTPQVSFVSATEMSFASTPQVSFAPATEVSFASTPQVSCIPAEVCSAATEMTIPVKMTMAAEKMSVVMEKAEAESDMVRKIGVRVGISESPGIVIAVRPGNFLAGIPANVTQ